MLNIILGRAKPKMENCLSESQSAYRQYRSTSDIIWAHRTLIARVQVYQEKIDITGVDMTSTFDIVKREKLLEILSSFLNKDEIRIIRVLLSNTKLNNINIEPFESNIGSPQGDALSGILFSINFENALSKVRSFFNVDETLTLPQEAIYADDAEFITNDKQKEEDHQRHTA